MGYLTARSTAQTLLSPGYPDNYENNENCGWLISTSDSSKKIQVEIVSLQLGNWGGGECEDYIQLADGKERNSASVLGTWCDPVQFQVKTSGQHLLVTFVSDAHVTGPGFALKYYHIDE
ncbi:metalloendopeptidase, partial [Elysia marginata]